MLLLLPHISPVRATKGRSMEMVLQAPGKPKKTE